LTTQSLARCLLWGREAEPVLALQLRVSPDAGFAAEKTSLCWLCSTGLVSQEGEPFKQARLSYRRDSQTERVDYYEATHPPKSEISWATTVMICTTSAAICGKF
jgi:hypothetical protein